MSTAFFSVLFLAIGLFEDPPWHISNPSLPWGPDSIYATTPFPIFPRFVNLTIEFLCILFFSTELNFRRRLVGMPRFFQTKAYIAILVLLVCNLLTTILSVPWPEFFFWRGVFRVGTVLFRSRLLREMFLTILGTLPDVGGMFILLVSHVVFSAFLGNMLFGSLPPPANSGFDTIGNSIWFMLALLTTTLFPETIMAQYTYTRWSALFFVAFLLIGVFLLLNIVLAVIFFHYRNRLRERLLIAKQDRTTGFDDAFALLDVEDAGWIPNDRVKALLEHLRPDDRHISQLAETFLDGDGDERITPEEFRNLHTVVHMRLKRRPPEFAYFVRMRAKHDRILSILVSIVTHSAFEMGINLILLGNAVAVIVQATTTTATKDGSDPLSWMILSVVINIIFTIEVSLKVVALGWFTYFASHWSKFDATVVIASDVVMMFTYISSTHYRLMQLVLLIRLLRLLRLFSANQDFTYVLHTFIRIVPVFSSFLAVEILLICAFAFIGVQFFGGHIYEGNPALAGTSFTRAGGLLPLNFNDFSSALMLLFTLVLNPNWDAVGDGTSKAVGSEWARVYFIAFFLAAVLVMTNLLVAFILEAFMAEWEARVEDERRKAEAAEREKSDSTGRREMLDMPDGMRYSIEHTKSAVLEKMFDRKGVGSLEE